MHLAFKPAPITPSSGTRQRLKWNFAGQGSVETYRTARENMPALQEVRPGIKRRKGNVPRTSPGLPQHDRSKPDTAPRPYTRGASISVVLKSVKEIPRLDCIQERSFPTLWWWGWGYLGWERGVSSFKNSR